MNPAHNAVCIEPLFEAAEPTPSTEEQEPHAIIGGSTQPPGCATRTRGAGWLGVDPATVSAKRGLAVTLTMQKGGLP